MAQLAIATVGAAAGFAIPGVGAQVGWAIGALVGSMVVPGPNTQGPRLTDAKITGVDYGEPIPWIAGTMRVAGQTWWASEVREISTTTSQGKGGGPTYTSYSYEADILYGLCSREITGVARIWSNGKLVWSMHADSSDDTLYAGRDAPWSEITIYTGANDQLPDPTYEAAVGAGNAPAYRGRGSVMIRGLQLGNSGIPPVLTFEVVVDGTVGGYLTRLQSYFDGDIGEDVSASDCGEAASGGEVSYADGKFVVNFPPAGGPGYIDWESTAFATDTTQAFTFEMFVNVGRSPDQSSADIVRFFNNISFDRDWNIGIATGNGYLLFGDAANGLLFQDTASPMPMLGRSHVALVITTTQRRLYLNGDLRYSDSGATVGLPGTANMRIGDAFGLQVADTNGMEYTVDSFRFRWEEVYTGASFTPPTELPPPDGPRLTPAGATIRETVEALCTRAGMSAAEFDASALDDIAKPVRGLVVAHGTSTRAVLEQLMAAYFFGAFAADKLYFVPRGGSIAETLDSDLMGAGEDGSQAEILPTEQQADEEIAAQVSVSYANVSADYNAGAELSDRILATAASVQSLSLGLAFTPAEAKGIADAAVLDGYMARLSAKAAVPFSAYAARTPTDVVRVPDEDGNLYRMRIVRRTDNGPQTEFELVLDDASVLESAGITSENYTPTVEVSVPGATLMTLLDIPLLRDADDTLGHYAAAKPSSGTIWPGCAIMRSVDGFNYVEAAQILERAVGGETLNALSDFDGGNVFDETSILRVDIGTGTLSSSTRAAMLLDTSINAMLVGSEVIRFRTATLSAGVYTLTGMLRGQLGTEWAMGEHTIGERVVILRTQGLRSIDIDTPSLSVVRYYKGVTLGRSLGSSTSFEFTCNGVRLKPWAPVQLRALEDSGGDFACTWNRRTRLATTFTGPVGSVVPLGETAEWYRVRVLDGDTQVFIDSVVTDQPYTLSPPSPGDYDGMTLEVCQVSATVGAGYPVTMTL